MNTSICISGLLRTWERVKDNVCANVIKDADVFCVSDDELSIQVKSSLVLTEAQNFYSQVNTEVFSENKRHETNVERCLNMYFKIFKCNELRKQYESDNSIKYDACVRLRTDTSFKKEVIIDNIQEDCLYISPDKGWGGICDQFAYGSCRVMDYYSNLFLNIGTYVEEGCIFHPETLLKYHCDKRGLKYVYLERNLFDIVR